MSEKKDQGIEDFISGKSTTDSEKFVEIHAKRVKMCLEATYTLLRKNDGSIYGPVEEVFKAIFDATQESMNAYVHERRYPMDDGNEKNSEDN